MKKITIAVGCFIQWYEVDMIEEYFSSLVDAMNYSDDDNIIVDIGVYSGQQLEQFGGTKKEYDELLKSIEDKINSYFKNNVNVTYYDEIYTIADYRRDFNDKYCEEADVLVWGESDMLVPKQMFEVIESLHSNVKENTPKYIMTFGINKMWDDSWKPLEHPEFTDKPHTEGDTENWWSVRYTMTKDEMDSFNNKISELDITNVSPHKFNGCGLVISSEVIKSGVNIPKSVFFVHEDTAFMLMTNKVLGEIPQYHVKNILLVHNRAHPKKRNYVEGESGKSLKEQRNSTEWYTIAHKMSEQNCYNVFNLAYTPFNWKNVWKTLESRS